MAYPTYRQDFEGGSTLATACPELVDVDVTGTGNIIDTFVFTGARSLGHVGAAHFMASNVADSLGGNLTFTLYFRCSTGTASMTMNTRCPTLGTSGGVGSASMSFSPNGINGAISGFSLQNNIWHCMELRVNGTTGSYRVIRQDTGQFFVNSGSGSWSTTPQTVINSAISAAAAGGWAFAGGDPTAIWVDDLIIEPASPVIDVPTFTLGSTGSTQQLTAGGFTDPLNRAGGPAGPAGTHVTWTSSNPNVATVSATGLVTAVFGGTATITATGKRDTGQTATATATVTALPLNVANWLYRLPVTVDNTANTTSALAYFQVHISLTGAAYSSFHAHAKADGSDLLITDSDGVTLLNFALEGIDNINSAVYLIVKVPRVAAASTRTIYVYYGNAAANSLSSYPSTIGPRSAIVGPTDIISQSDVAGYNDGSWMVLFQNQDKAHGGGASLNGKIYLISNTGQSGNPSTGGNITAMVSSDGGVTWGTKTALATADSTHGFSAQSLTELADGTMLMCYGYDLGTSFAAGFEHWYIAKSTNGGATWTNLSNSPTNPITGPWTYGTDLAVLFGPLIETTPGGTLYKTSYGALSGQSYWREWLLKCAGGVDPTVGSNWSLQGTIANDGAGTYGENSILNTGGNNWISVTRKNNGTGDLYLNSSTDNGATWSAPVAIGLQGVVNNGTNIAVSPELKRLASGNILLTFGIRFPAPTATWGCAALVSTDNGATWTDRAPVIPLPYSTVGVAVNGYGDFGYPSAVQNADGTIVITGYHEVGGVITTTNVARSIVTEDWIVNSANQYDACESFSAAWTTHEANLTIDATHVHSGVSAIKADNSAGHAMVGYRVSWLPDASLVPQNVAFSFWLYASQNAGNISWTTKIASGVSSRTACYVDGTGATQHVNVYTGAAYTDSTVTAPLNSWNKHSVYGHIPPATSAISQTHARLNNAVLTPTPGNIGAAVGAAAIIGFQFGSESANTATTAWLDDLYTHQFTANIPVVTAGAEQLNAFGPAAVTLAPDTVTAHAVALLPITAPSAIALAPDTVTATAVTFLPKLASAAIALAPDTISAHALAVVPGAATAVGSFTLRADIVACVAQPFVQTTSTYLLIDPEQTTRL